MSEEYGPMEKALKKLYESMKAIRALDVGADHTHRLHRLLNACEWVGMVWEPQKAELRRLHAMEKRVKEINPAIDKEGNLVLVITSKPQSNLCWRTIQAQLLGDGNETKETQ